MHIWFGFWRGTNLQDPAVLQSQDAVWPQWRHDPVSRLLTVVLQRPSNQRGQAWKYNEPHYKVNHNSVWTQINCTSNYCLITEVKGTITLGDIYTLHLTESQVNHLKKDRCKPALWILRQIDTGYIFQGATVQREGIQLILFEHVFLTLYHV